MSLNIEKKELVKNIEKLSKIELEEIFNLLNSKNIEYTSNNNGVFINLKNFDKNLVKELQNYVLFLQNNNKKLDIDIKNNIEIVKNYNKNNIDLIENFVEYVNLKDIEFLSNINLKRKRKKENYMKFINTKKKYNRILLNINDNELIFNELTHEKYKL
jgi:hypothetical protein|tara:strand:- start:77 stop:550 length:474 start_codon:yes stop_codon:yes gene_type:complete